MTLDEALAVLRSHFTFVDGLPMALAQTGEEYVVFGMTIQDNEGVRIERCSSFDAMVRSWLDSILRYADGRGSTLYWRVRPETDTATWLRPMYRKESDAFDGWEPVQMHAIYARLLVSDKPVRWPDMDAYERDAYERWQVADAAWAAVGGRPEHGDAA